MRSLDTTNLLGVDVGYSHRAATTGMAWSVAGAVAAATAHTAWSDRRAKLPPETTFGVIAVDGPLLPAEATPDAKRGCEAVFIRSPFHNRCKPGCSHHGTGLDLRRATTHAAQQFASVLHPSKPPAATPLRPAATLVEAFPNAFLGVLIPDDVHRAAPPLKRGARFDWLYDRAAERGAFSVLLERLGWHAPSRAQSLVHERHHERRAALVCLLTAACAATHTATRVGDAATGWFWLPPWDLWQEWARDGVHQALQAAQKSGHAARVMHAASPD